MLHWCAFSTCTHITGPFHILVLVNGRKIRRRSDKKPCGGLMTSQSFAPRVDVVKKIWRHTEAEINRRVTYGHACNRRVVLASSWMRGLYIRLYYGRQSPRICEASFNGYSWLSESSVGQPSHSESCQLDEHCGVRSIMKPYIVVNCHRTTAVVGSTRQVSVLFALVLSLALFHIKWFV